MKLPAALAATALAVQVAGAPPPAVARAYERVAEVRPHVLAHQDTKRGRQELLRWQAILATSLTRTQTTVYETILVHYNHERGTRGRGTSHRGAGQVQPPDRDPLRARA